MTIDIAVTGVSGPIGARLLSIFDAEPDVGRVVGLDARDPERRARKLEFHGVDIAASDIKPFLEGVDVVIHLAGATRPILDAKRMAYVNIEGTRRVLDATAAVGASRLVRLSSAAVYGAWPNNPVPLSEDAPLRPNPGFAPALQAAEVERMIAEWRRQHPAVTVVVFRCAPVIGADDFVMRMLRRRLPLRVRGASPAVQVVHADDVATAMVQGCRAPAGVYNVSADGWLTADEAGTLVSSGFVPAVPLDVLHRMLSVAWRSGAGDIPPSVLPYVTHSWAIANDRLRATGWTPTYTNAEALVAAVVGVPPLRIGRWVAAGSVALGAAVATGVMVRRRG